MIPFNKAPFLGCESEYVLKAMQSRELCGDQSYSKLCQSWFEQEFQCKKTLLTPSCTAALEMAAILIGIEPGDEVIMPSYTFVSTANAFVLRGAKIIFVDIKSKDMNIDETKIEAAITDRTKAIVPVHYAGVSCEMDTIMSIAEKYGLIVVEDAAQGVMSQYKGRALGTIGHLGAFSFHETKNYTSGGEGGLLLINDEKYLERAEVIREKGTNRSLFFRGMVDKYSWVDVGSSFLPSELQAAYLYGQMENAHKINDNRLSSWNNYYKQLESLQKKGKLVLPDLSGLNIVHNAHMFYIKVKDLDERQRLMSHLKECDIQTAFHYVPLHSAKAGLEFGQFNGCDEHTTSESEKLIRLPLWYDLPERDITHIVNSIKEFYSE